MIRYLCFCIVMSLSLPALALRDIFLKPAIIVQDTLLTSEINDFSFLGAMQVDEHSTLGLIKDTVNQLHVVQVGGVIGLKKAKVIKILPEQIVITDGKQFFSLRVDNLS